MYEQWLSHQCMAGGGARSPARGAERPRAGRGRPAQRGGAEGGPRSPGRGRRGTARMDRGPARGARRGRRRSESLGVKVCVDCERNGVRGVAVDKKALCRVPDHGHSAKIPYF